MIWQQSGPAVTISNMIQGGALHATSSLSGMFVVAVIGNHNQERQHQPTDSDVHAACILKARFVLIKSSVFVLAAMSSGILHSALLPANFCGM